MSDREWLLKQAKLINETAQIIYGAVQSGGIDLNFFKCYELYQDGVFGWVKENSSFETAMDIYEVYTNNDSWDDYNRIVEEFPEINQVEDINEIIL